MSLYTHKGFTNYELCKTAPNAAAREHSRTATRVGLEMEHVFWLKEGIIAGRTGPDLNPWNLDKIKARGFSAILSVNSGEAVHETLISNLGIRYSRIPMSSNAPVKEGDEELCLRNLPKAMRFINDNLAHGPVLVHCRSGKDRTGMVLAAYLVSFEGDSVKDAMNKVLSVRPVAFSAEGWLEFGHNVLTQYLIVNTNRP